MSWPIALMKWLAAQTSHLGVAEHTYVVGGAVRNHILGQPIKDLDIVIDSVASGQDAAWLAERLADVIPVRANLVTNQYGVAILTIKGDWIMGGANLADKTIEIATARKESYGGAEGKGYKPHMVEPATIREDVFRREFTFNTLLWRFSGLLYGPQGAPITDLIGSGMQDLEGRVLRTPADPDKTFSDDPTRMLRAIKFVARYGFKIQVEVEQSITRNAGKLHTMPWNAVQEILVRDIIGGPEPRVSLSMMLNLGLAQVIREMTQREPGFASGLGRALNDIQDVELLLDIDALEWAVRSPITFLDPIQRVQLANLVRSWPTRYFYDEFFVHLVRPPIDQPALFEAFGLQGKDRARVLQIARQSLLERPELAGDPSALKAAVEAALRA